MLYCIQKQVPHKKTTKRRKQKMTVAERIYEIKSQLHSFDKRSYHKTEILPELFALQSELVEILFAGEDIDKASLKI